MPVVGGRISRFPYKELPHMPVSLTTLGRPDARDGAPDVLPSTVGNASASQKYVVFEAQWLAYALPCRRFTFALTDDGARLGADVVRYSFIVVDLHHLLFAGFDRRTSRQDLCKKIRALIQNGFSFA